MEHIVPLCLGLGLAASCGFRIFVPMLGLSIAAMTGHLHLASGFEWVGTLPALVCFSVATVVEIIAFYVPWVDNALDTIAIPAAVIAGTILTAAVVTEMSPLMPSWDRTRRRDSDLLAVVAGASSRRLDARIGRHRPG